MQLGGSILKETCAASDHQAHMWSLLPVNREAPPGQCHLMSRQGPFEQGAAGFQPRRPCVGYNAQPSNCPSQGSAGLHAFPTTLGTSQGAPESPTLFPPPLQPPESIAFLPLDQTAAAAQPFRKTAGGPLEAQARPPNCENHSEEFTSREDFNQGPLQRTLP